MMYELYILKNKQWQLHDIMFHTRMGAIVFADLATNRRRHRYQIVSRDSEPSGKLIVRL